MAFTSGSNVNKCPIVKCIITRSAHLKSYFTATTVVFVVYA